MLFISGTNRPEWDKQLLESYEATVTIDSTVGPRIYAEEDEFLYSCAYVFGESD